MVTPVTIDVDEMSNVFLGIDQEYDSWIKHGLF